MHYCLQGHLGTGLVMVDAWGHVQQQSVYYPFGGERVITNNVANNHKFTGLERDSETGLDHTLNRQYSSALGRWLSPDPVRGVVSDPRTQDLYSYTTDNPTTEVDPTGECGCDPDDPSCGNGFGGGPPFGFGSITVNFSCPDNKPSCCGYWDNVAARSPCAAEVAYAHLSKFVCEDLTGIDCLENCVRSCLVHYDQSNCDRLPDCSSRLYCREVSAHYHCALDCAFWAVIPGGFTGNAHLTIPIPLPVDITYDVTVPYACPCTSVGGCI